MCFAGPRGISRAAAGAGGSGRTDPDRWERPGIPVFFCPFRSARTAVYAASSAAGRSSAFGSSKRPASSPDFGRRRRRIRSPSVIRKTVFRVRRRGAFGGAGSLGSPGGGEAVYTVIGHGSLRHGLLGGPGSLLSDHVGACGGLGGVTGRAAAGAEGEQQKQGQNERNRLFHGRNLLFFCICYAEIQLRRYRTGKVPPKMKNTEKR